MTLRSLRRSGGAAVVAAGLLFPQAAAAQSVSSGKAVLETAGGWSRLSSLWDLVSHFFLEDESDNRGSIDPNGVNRDAAREDTSGDNRASIDPDG